MDIESKVTLNNGVEMPWLGLGVFGASAGGVAEQAVRWALEIGYRHIDTAAGYGNEADVGRGVKRSGIEREEIFITTKVRNDDQGYESTLKAFDESRSKLDMDVVDLYLVHWPVTGMHLDTWKALETLYSQGKVRAIGVSNYMRHHLEDLFQSFDVVPAVNQVEFHPFLLQKELLDFDNEHNILHEAWSPLTRNRRLDDPMITEVARKYERTNAQVMLRWDLQLGVATIPKSENRGRIEENSRIFDFELSEEDMEKLTSLDEDGRIGPHPDTFV
jgi:diketogulonate reductase-like aldo/keto reductase